MWVFIFFFFRFASIKEMMIFLRKIFVEHNTKSIDTFLKLFINPIIQPAFNFFRGNCKKLGAQVGLLD